MSVGCTIFSIDGSTAEQFGANTAAADSFLKEIREPQLVLGKNDLEGIAGAQAFALYDGWNAVLFTLEELCGFDALEDATEFGSEGDYGPALLLPSDLTHSVAKSIFENKAQFTDLLTSAVFLEEIWNPGEWEALPAEEREIFKKVCIDLFAFIEDASKDKKALVVYFD